MLPIAISNHCVPLAETEQHVATLSSIEPNHLSSRECGDYLPPTKRSKAIFAEKKVLDGGGPDKELSGQKPSKDQLK